MDIIKDFDRAIKVMKKDAMGNPELMKEVESLEAKRTALMEASLTKNTRASMAILKEAFRVERLIHTAKNEPQKEKPGKVEGSEDDEFSLAAVEKTKEKPAKKLLPLPEKIELPWKPKIPEKIELPWKTDKEKEEEEKLAKAEKELETAEKEMESLTEEFKPPPKPTTKELEFNEKLTPEEQGELDEENKKRLVEIENQFKQINEECEHIRKNWKNLDEIRGDYSELTEQMKDVKKDVERIVKEKKRVRSQLKELKEKVSDVHTRKNREFGMTKDAYKYFWNELLMVSVKLSEIEELFDKNERVTEMDLLELKTNVDALDKKLGAVSWVAAKRRKRKSKRG